MRNLFVILFFAAAAFAFVMAVLPHPPQFFPSTTSDKLQHMTAFAVLAGLATPAFPRVPFVRLLAYLSVFGALIEVVQAIPALHRDCDVKDWIADTFATGAVLATMRWLRLREVLGLAD